MYDIYVVHVLLRLVYAGYLLYVCLLINDQATTEIYTYLPTPSLPDVLPFGLRPNDSGNGALASASQRRRAKRRQCIRRRDCAPTDRRFHLPRRHGAGERRPAKAHNRQVRARQIGRAPCRERGCPYVEISVVAVSVKQKNTKQLQETR